MQIIIGSIMPLHNAARIDEIKKDATALRFDVPVENLGAAIDALYEKIFALYRLAYGEQELKKTKNYMQSDLASEEERKVSVVLKEMIKPSVFQMRDLSADKPQPEFLERIAKVKEQLLERIPNLREGRDGPIFKRSNAQNPVHLNDSGASQRGMAVNNFSGNYWLPKNALYRRENELPANVDFTAASSGSEAERVNPQQLELAKS